MWINISAAWLCLFIPCWCCFWSLLDENEILDALGLLLGQIQWDENTFQEIPLEPVFVLISRDTQGSNSLESGGITVEERHTENTSKVCPSNPPKEMSPGGIAVMSLNHKLFLLKATVWQSKSLSSQAFWILNGPWAQTGTRAVAPWHTFYSLDPQPLSSCPSVHQSVPSVLSPVYSKPHFRGCFSGLLVASQGGLQLKRNMGTLPCTEVLFWLYYGVASFLFLSSYPHISSWEVYLLGEVIWTSGNILLLNTCHYTTSLRQIVPDRMICTL